MSIWYVATNTPTSRTTTTDFCSSWTPSSTATKIARFLPIKNVSYKLIILNYLLYVSWTNFANSYTIVDKHLHVYTKTVLINYQINLIITSNIHLIAVQNYCTCNQYIGLSIKFVNSHWCQYPNTLLNPRTPEKATQNVCLHASAVIPDCHTNKIRYAFEP